MLVYNKKGRLEYFTVEKFSASGAVKHCFSTRRGGVSCGIYESMNLRFNCEDSRENVLKNFEILCSAQKIDYKSLVLTKQVHEDIIKSVTHKDCGNGIMYENRFSSADGLICAEPGVPLTVFGADCLPIMFLDQEQRVIATAHSGWRGTLLGIARKTVVKMLDEYGCRPENIVAAIGPSIRVCHYEVNDELAEKFYEKFGASVLEKHGEKWHISMQAAVKQQLNEVGVRHVADSDMCTYCNSDMLFSHRKTKGHRGVMVGIIELI